MNGAPSNAETPGLVASAELDRTPMARFQQCLVTDGYPRRVRAAGFAQAGY
jgi:hypothetical protein